MKYKDVLKKANLIIIVVVLLNLFLLPAAAQEIDNCSWTKDNQGFWKNECPYDDIPALTTVIDRNSDGIVDFKKDIWLFDAYKDGKIDLIILFKSIGDQALALLFDDQTGDGLVEYEFDNDNQFRMIESLHPTVTVVAENGWFIDDSKVNFNIQIEVDGPVFSIPSYDRFFDLILNDGRIDYKIDVQDVDLNGWPDSDFRYATTSLPEAWGLYRVAGVSGSGFQPKTHQPHIFWPYLGMLYGTIRETNGIHQLVTNFDVRGNAYGYIQPANSWYPPIQMEWSRSRIAFVAEFVPSRNRENGFFMYSLPPLSPENPVYKPDFENPFAYYDLEEDKDGVAELMVRAETYDIFDQHFFGGIYDKPLTSIRYSWDQNKDNITDMAVKLLGNHSTAQQEIKIGNNTILSIPYDQFPSWALSRSWLAATFVQEMVPTGYWSEGLYDWPIPRILRDDYYTGLISEEDPLAVLANPTYYGWDEADGHTFSSIRANTRGDYSLNFNREPMLYFGSIDHLLHLKYAQGGLWNINNNSSLHYQNTGGAYIDVFRLEDAKSIRTLYSLCTSLAYEANGQIRVKQVAVPPAVFETLPPRNHAEWSELGSKIAENAANFQPYDLEKMYIQFPGPEVVLESASIHDFRQNANGYRFVLEIDSGYQVSGEDLSGWQNLTPGKYLVTYRDEAYMFQPLSPVNLAVALKTGQQNIRVSEQMHFGIQVQNVGMPDIAEKTLKVTANNGQGENEIITRQVTLLSGEDYFLPFDWQPQEKGEWEINANVMDSEGTVIGSSTVKLVVRGNEAIQPWFASTLASSDLIVPMLLLLVTSVLVAVGVFHLGFQKEQL